MSGGSGSANSRCRSAGGIWANGGPSAPRRAASCPPVRLALSLALSKICHRAAPLMWLGVRITRQRQPRACRSMPWRQAAGWSVRVSSTRDALETPVNTRWCNGSTTGFGPVSLGSNPSRVTWRIDKHFRPLLASRRIRSQTPETPGFFCCRPNLSRSPSIRCAAPCVSRLAKESDQVVYDNSWILVRGLGGEAQTQRLIATVPTKHGRPGRLVPRAAVASNSSVSNNLIPTSFC